ncbi:valine--tRNA ligase [Spelaeicoccus albus]|uniref:valine--tRNA ligase n=1 Tax=Spelaeicoccus albus TaxID=1280376 RepID=UPI001F0224CC|nr:valine--tRNA ligase [Spelaeicoccus albus]
MTIPDPNSAAAPSPTTDPAVVPAAGRAVDQAAPTVTVPDKPSVEGLAAKWDAVWHQQHTYAFDRTAPREKIYSIDTPPPTASGSLHVGHIFSYTQTDVIARFQRMRGKEVFYPLGWDDNGLPTERRVQNYFGVRCDPTLAYDESFEPPEKPAKNSRDFVAVSRRNFIELCERLAVTDEKVFEDLFRKVGVSVDWSLTYRTIDDVSRAVSQRAFLANLASGDAYSADAPTMWDVSFRTAVAQAELEDRERPGAYHRVAFASPDGGKPVHIDTTRPELIPAVVALVAHPDDERYQPLFGTTVKSPIFGVEVPVVAHELAKADKGSGIAMICTFGDMTDVTWWRELNLPTRPVVGRDGRIIADVPAWISDGADGGADAYSQLAGKTTFTAREIMVDLLRESGDLDGDPKPVTHPVPFYEKGDKPLEVVTSRQWYIRNGGRDADRRETLVGRGREMNWHPEFMRSRYENWVDGLNGDWLVSRQRFFGVPMPLWYRLDAEGRPDYADPIVPDDAALPVDPAADPAPGFTGDQRDQPGGFIADPDVLDTWATSSLTPQILGGWSRDEELFAKVFPFDLRPQAHDIIRTWLFSTVVRANALQSSVPWTNTAISGWILDPDRKKMSKSKGNVVVPSDILVEEKPGFGPDAVRYWAASARLGADTAYNTDQMKIGRRLAMKLLNASKFALNLGADSSAILGTEGMTTVPNSLDRSVLTRLATVTKDATAAMEAYDYAKALNLTESFFWTFTDDYVELIKDRAYGAAGDEQKQSALTTLATSLDTLLRLFAPFLPFATEEVWSWWRRGSVHRAAWPVAADVDGDSEVLTALGAALGEVRRAKSEAKVSQRTEVKRAVISATQGDIDRIESGAGDLRAAGRVADLELTAAADASDADITVSDVELVPADG